MKTKSKIALVVVFVMSLIALSSVIMAKEIKFIYPNKYKYWPTNSSIVNSGKWNLVFSKSNDSSSKYNCICDIKNVEIWQWFSPIPIGKILPDEDEIGFSQATHTLKITIPSFETFSIYRKYVTWKYEYLYQKGEVILYDDNTTSFRPYGPAVKFYKIVVVPEYKTSLSSINDISLNSSKINIVYYDLSKWNLHGIPSDFYVNSDQYGNIVIFKRTFPRRLYVINIDKGNNRLEELDLPFLGVKEENGKTFIKGVDVFQDTIALAMFKTTVTSTSMTSNSPTISTTSQLLLYNSKTGKIKKVLSLNSFYISNPNFSMNGKDITYNVYDNKNNETAIFVLNLKNSSKKLLYKNVNTIDAPNSAWSKNGNVCFGNLSGEFVVALKKGKSYTFLKIEKTPKDYWYYISSPFFISDDIVGFVDKATSTLKIFNIHTGKVVKTEKLNVSPNHLVSVQYTDGKILVISVGK